MSTRLSTGKPWRSAISIVRTPFDSPPDTASRTAASSAPGCRGPSAGRRARPCGAEAAEPGDHRAVVGAAAVAVQLDPVVEHSLDVIEGVRTIGVPGQLDRAPDLLVSRLGLNLLELALEALQLAGDLRAAEQRGAAETRQPLTQPVLGLTRHCRRAARAWPCTAAAPSAGRSRRGGRSEGWTPREAEVVRELLTRGLLDDARTGERDQTHRLGDGDIAETREAREYAGGGRVGEDVQQRAARVAQVLDRADRLRQLHRDRIPSCMRAPPEEVTATSGTRRSAACSHARTNFLADDAAHRAAHEAEVHHRELAGLAVDLGSADHDRVALAGLQLGLGEAFGVRPQVEEAERIGGAELAVPPPRRTRCRRAARSARAPRAGSGGRTGGTPPGCARARRHDSATRRRAGVRVLPPVVRRRCAFVLDGDVDALRHGLLILDRGRRESGYRPAPERHRQGRWRAVGGPLRAIGASRDLGGMTTIAPHIRLRGLRGIVFFLVCIALITAAATTAQSSSAGGTVASPLVYTNHLHRPQRRPSRGDGTPSGRVHAGQEPPASARHLAAWPWRKRPLELEVLGRAPHARPVRGRQPRRMAGA